MLHMTVNTDAPRVYVPTLQSSMVLIDLSIRAWNARAKDVNASRKVEADANADMGVVSVSKKLTISHKLVEIHKKVALMRNHHTKLTTVWGDLGQRALPLAIYNTKYHPVMVDYQNEFNALVADFLPDYPTLREAARTSLGSLFNEKDYPSEDTIHERFSFKYTPTPMPEAGHFAIDLQNEAHQQMREQYEAAYGDRLRGVVNEVWERAFKAVSHMIERLDYQGEDDKKKFHDTLVTNVHEAITMLEEFNVFGDEDMARAKRQLESALSGVNAEALRRNKGLRDETREAVASVAAQMKALPGLGF
jgi:hypothetical protein